MKKSPASRKVEWLETPGSQSEEDEDELEENELVLEDC